MPKADTYRATAESRGLYYLVWRLFWPVVVTIIFVRHPGSLGLRPPSTPTIKDLPRLDRVKYRKWWRNYIWNGTRIALGTGRGEVNGLAHVALATYLLIIGVIFNLHYRGPE